MGVTFLLKVTCRWCGQVFYVCHSCWRGQAYCSEICRVQGYRRNNQRRQRKYRKSKNGKKIHCRNENKRKKRLAAKKVGDATSNTISSLIFSPQNIKSNSPCCRICGKKGEIVSSFPRRRYGSPLQRESANRYASPGTSKWQLLK